STTTTTTAYLIQKNGQRLENYCETLSFLSAILLVFIDADSGYLHSCLLMLAAVDKVDKVNASNGTTEAGLSNGNEGSDAESLSRPTAVWVDEETHVVYVADSSNERIQRWLYNASVGDTIAGGSGLGDKPNRFDQPVDLAFDNNGNLYVELSRIQIDLNTQHFIDEYGRIFHDDDSNNLHQWGFYTSWMGVNYHSEDEINQEYLSQLSIAIQMKENKGIYALLDCHQDIFSRYFCGEGVSD
ncbi:unnamed protein product, partial [Rotaria sordida]